jgi:dihydroneopterin aldolase
METTIIINELSCILHIGVSDEERKETQKILLDLEIDVNTNAHVTDNIEETVSYSSIQKEIREQIIKHKEYKLLESLGNDITTHLLQKFPKIIQVKCTCSKPNIAKKYNAKKVGVKIVRSR